MFLPINRWRKLASRAVEHNEVSPVVVLVPGSMPEEECEHAVGAILARTSIGEYSREPTNAKRYMYYTRSLLNRTISRPVIGVCRIW
jgi:hypothetical protein